MKSRFVLTLSIFSTFVAAPLLRADVGNLNPTGPAGSFNGNVTTGCSYDVFTGNATRAMTDLVVPGAVGSYPLAFGRTANSRSAMSGQFGSAGGRQHSYSWDLDGSETSNRNPSFAPTYYTVSFPDGRVITFTHSSPSDPYFRGPPGVQERFQPLNTNTGSLLAYLVLPDGGRVEFKATRVSECDYELHPPCTYSYSYQAQAIIDPYGARTLLAYNGDGTLNTITEPAGRWIQLIYGFGPPDNYGYRDQVIDHVTASDGRSVQYIYARQAFYPAANSYTYLSNVVYYGDNSLTATYTYTAPNTPNTYTFLPRLLTCDDPMYAGPMKKILYEYATGTNGDNSAVEFGQIRFEKSIDGQTVSTLQLITSGRAEVKGDGSTRYFDFPSIGYQVSNWSDFENFFPRALNQYDPNTGFLSSFGDRNGNTTNIASDPLTGNPTTITFPLTASDSALGKPPATVQYVYGSATCPDPNNRDGINPYYLYSATNERGLPTIYSRDVNKRVTRIDYPDGGFETFAYDGLGLGQVTEHRLRTGGLETFTYDGASHLLTEYRDDPGVFLHILHVVPMEGPYQNDYGRQRACHHDRSIQLEGAGHQDHSPSGAGRSESFERSERIQP
ncbi:MAG TPA: hypothetical protein VE031_07015 [Chthoniobacterales bacterium]|nr:hypothetical protein [Chthoniobacterales bacterium]